MRGHPFDLHDIRYISDITIVCVYYSNLEDDASESGVTFMTCGKVLIFLQISKLLEENILMPSVEYEFCMNYLQIDWDEINEERANLLVTFYNTHTHFQSGLFVFILP